MNIVDFLHGLANLAAEEPLLLLVLLLAVGGALGAVSVRGFSLGPAAVLFTALALSAFDDRLALDRAVGILGLAFFAYVVGVGAGPSFFNAFRSGGKVIAATVLALVLGGVATVLLGSALGVAAGVLLPTLLHRRIGPVQARVSPMANGLAVTGTF